MANSVVTATGDGVTVQYTLNFTLGILRRDYVTCRVGSEVDGAGNPVYRTLEWVSDSIVNIQGTVPANGESIVFTRTVPKNLLIHDYSNGVPVEESNLDESNLQTIMAVHEFLDGRIEGGFVQDMQMNGYKIVNLGDGVADTDAANMRQLNETTTAANAAVASTAAAVASTAAAVTTCTTKASEASASATESENWATKTDGIVESTDYSSKAFAIGGTGVTDTAGRGAAKEWAAKAEDSTVDGTEYSAKHYSAKASASAEAASTSAASLNIASPTASKHGALLYQNDADDGYVALTAQGTSSQVLTSNGPDAAPSWQDAAGGKDLPNGGYVNSRFYVGGICRESATYALSADTLYGAPFVVGEQNTFTRIGIDVNATGTATDVRLGLYEISGGVPTDLVFDAGTVSVGTTGTKEITISQSISPGVYCLAVVANGTVTLTGGSGGSAELFNHVWGQSVLTSSALSVSASHTYGALPDPFPSVSYVGNVFLPIMRIV